MSPKSDPSPVSPPTSEARQWLLEWCEPNDCYTLLRADGNGGMDQIDLFVDEPTAKAAQTALNSHDALLAAAEAALPLLLLAAIKAPDRECAKQYSDTCCVLTAAIKAAKGGVA